MSATRVQDVGELELVERVRSLLQAPVPGLEVGPGDDAAVIELSTRRLVLTTDRQTEGSHFRRSWISPRALGRRALAVCVSDLGAMGATPVWALCALELPGDLEVAWLDELVEGLHDGGRELGCPTIGGDVTLSRHGVGLCLCAGGTLAEGVPPTLRDGAEVDDACWIVGHLGRAAAGRLLLAAEVSEAASSMARRSIAAYREPRPPLAFASHVAEHRLVGAMMDVSDGLGLDLGRLCTASHVGVTLDGSALIDADVAALESQLGTTALDLAVGGGDDYALICAVEARNEDRFAAAAASFEVDARRVGLFVSVADGLTVRIGDRGEPLTGTGWDPFSGGAAS